MTSRAILLSLTLLLGCSARVNTDYPRAILGCYESPGAAWDSIQTELLGYEPNALPTRVVFASTPRGRVLAEDGNEITWDPVFPPDTSRIGYFVDSVAFAPVSWRLVATDSVYIGRHSGFGGFYFGGRVLGDSLVGQFRFYTDNGFHPWTFAPATLKSVDCEAPAGRGI